MNNKNLKKGFTLLELVFVIAILGIIAAFAIPKLLDSRGDAIVSTVKQDVATISTSIQSYYMINNGISKITDAVNINDKLWQVSNKVIKYSVKNVDCITMTVSGSDLIVNIDSNSSDICQKLSDTGIKNVTYEMF